MADLNLNDKLGMEMEEKKRGISFATGADLSSPCFADSAPAAEQAPSMKKMNLTIVTEFPENSANEHSGGTRSDNKMTPTPGRTPGSVSRRRRNLPGTPDPTAEVVALSPEILLAANRYVCEVCHKGFQRDQNLQLHRRGHNLPWKLRQRTAKESKKKVYICPEPSCVHHSPARALGDLTGIKKHFSRKHGKKKYKCSKCSKMYAVLSDCKAHMKVCGTKEYRCECGTMFSRRDSFITHRAFCESLNLQRLVHQSSVGQRETTPSPKEGPLKFPSGEMEIDNIMTPTPKSSLHQQQSPLTQFADTPKNVPANLESLILQAAMVIQQNKGLLGSDISSLSTNLLSLGIDVNDMSQLTLLVNFLTFLQQQQGAGQKSTPTTNQPQSQQQNASNLFSHLFGSDNKSPTVQTPTQPQQSFHNIPSQSSNHQRTLSSISDVIASLFGPSSEPPKPPAAISPSFGRQHKAEQFSHSLASIISSQELQGHGNTPNQTFGAPPASPLGRVTTQQLQEISRMRDQQNLIHNLEKQIHQHLQQADMSGNFTRDFIGVNGGSSGGGLNSLANLGGLADLLR